MKGDGYPEDSTQFAYSSQLIWIPLSHHFFLFYLWGFISREATKRQYRGGDQNQRLGKMPADVRKYVSLPHFRLEKLSASDRTSRTALVFPSMQTFRALSQFALSHFCLGRRRSDWKSSLSRRACRTSRLNRLRARLVSYCWKDEARCRTGGLGATEQCKKGFFENISKRVEGISETQFSGSVTW